MSSEENILVDGIQSLGIHNGVARLQLIQIHADGKPKPAVQLAIPVKVIPELVDALKKSMK